MKQFLLSLLIIAAIGCGQPEADPKVESDRLQGAKQMRELYDKAGGDYSRLSAGDHDTFVKSFAGNEENAKRMWDTMGTRGATSAPGQPTPGMPGGVSPSGG